MTNKSVPKSNVIPRSRWLRLAQILWYPAAAVALGIMIAAMPQYFAGLSNGSLDELLRTSRSNWNFVLSLAYTAASLSAGLLSLGLAWVLFCQKRDERMAIFLSYFLLFYGVFFAGPIWMLVNQSHEPSFRIALFISSFFYPLLITLILIFPDGRFVPAWTRWLVILTISAIPLESALFSANPEFFTSPLFWIGILLLVPITLIAFSAQIYRYRVVSDSDEKQQTKWVVYGLSLMFLSFVITTPPYIRMLQSPPDSPLMWWGTITTLIYSVSLTFLPLSLTIAVLRYRLYKIDLLINRTLVFGALTVTTLGIYVFMVGYLGNLLQAFNQTILAFVATGFVALLFQPMRERLQVGVNRLMFGERDDPIAVMSSLSKRLEGSAEPELVLPGIVDTVGKALKLPYVAIEVYNGQTAHVVAEYGVASESAEHLPLIHQSNNIGQLIFARRSPNESFSEAEYALLRNISRQTGAAVHAAKLTADLRRSRQQLVTTREEERRRLRRDLHDGLGPTLAGATLRIDIARNLLSKNPDQADTILVEIKGQIQDTIGDVRRLVYGLRPPVLDELGLEKAIRSFIDQENRSGLKITIEVSYELATLPAAVEVAVYHIARDGITNVIRHAQATKASIRIFPRNGDLSLEIKDNGTGLSDPISNGVGMTSLRERAEELGGQVELIPQAPGTLLRACLPCTVE